MFSKSKILIFGSTGKLGSKLLSFCFQNNISIDCITSFSNYRKMKKQSKKLSIKNSFCLSYQNQNILLKKFLNDNLFDVIYFLDFGSQSLEFIDILLKKNTSSIFGIANKEMIIAGGPLLIQKIKKTKNKLIPLDSEHFSLFRSSPINDEIYKIYITASGGPFYFKKKINLDKVNLNQVLNHPKWKMGINNSIDSSNFINKLLEMYELSSIYNIDLKKIDFLISQHAYIHSIIIYKDSTISINCFKNDMLITLIKPLEIAFSRNFIKNQSKHHFMDTNLLNLSKFNDKRFKLFKYINKLKKISHKNQIKLMVLNNIAQKKYLEKQLKYNEIVPFIMKNLDNNSNTGFSNFEDILSYIKQLSYKYENYVF